MWIEYILQIQIFKEVVGLIVTKKDIEKVK